MKRSRILFILLSVSLFLLLITSIATGSVRIPLYDVINSFFNPGKVPSNTLYIVRNIRAPKSFGAVLVGMSLALSGLVFQTVFKNPMADSYVLGVSSSASFAVCLFSVLGLNSIGHLTLPFCAFVGSVICTLLLFSSSGKKPFEILLKGVSLNFLLSAATTLLLFLNRKGIENVVFWTMGSLSSLTWPKVLIICIASVLGLSFFLSQSTVMDILLLDDSTAISSGIDLEKRRIILTLAASFLTSACVSFTGIIGFIGLMSPHFVRLISGPKHKNLIILSALFGSDILLLAEIISKTIIAPSELPVGIITSLLGSPVLILLIRRRSEWIRK